MAAAGIEAAAAAGAHDQFLWTVAAAAGLTTPITGANDGITCEDWQDGGGHLCLAALGRI